MAIACKAAKIVTDKVERPKHEENQLRYQSRI